MAPGGPGARLGPKVPKVPKVPTVRCHYAGSNEKKASQSLRTYLKKNLTNACFRLLVKFFVSIVEPKHSKDSGKLPKVPKVPNTETQQERFRCAGSNEKKRTTHSGRIF